MQIILKATQELIPYENNPRNNDEAVQYVAESIKQFGFKVPIIIDSENIIVAGHTRLKAALQLGLEKVPCIIASDLNEQQIKAFRLADNKVGEIADWDYEQLRQELEGIDNIDMEELGFCQVDDMDFSEFFNDYEPEPKPKQQIECPYCHEMFEKKR